MSPARRSSIGPRAILLAALAALACAWAPAAVAAPEETLPPGLTLSLQDDHLAVTPEGGIAARLDLLASTGVRVTRVDVLWNAVAPTRPADGADPDDPAYRWSRYDLVVDGLTRRGIAAIFNVYRTPSWANGGRRYEWAPDEGHYADFMTALARRYDGVTRDRAGLAHGPVELFQAWNEPNLSRFLLPQWRTEADGSFTSVGPGVYAGLLTRAYRSVKAVQPQAWVIGAGAGPNNTDNPPGGSTSVISFVRGLVPYAPPADAFAQHLYPALGPRVSTAMPSFTRLPELIGELDAVRPGLPIMITEFGWTTSPTSVRPSHVSEDLQATYLAEAVDMLAAIPRVRLAVWFNLQDNAEWTAGLRRSDLSLKPSWDVFARTPKFVGAEPAPAPSAPPAASVPAGPAPATSVTTALGAIAQRRRVVARRPKMTRARCLALKRARRPLPGVCRSRFAIAPPRRGRGR